MTIRLIASTLCVWMIACSASAPTEVAIDRPAYDAPGDYASPTNECSMSLTSSASGGAIELKLGDESVAQDVSGVAWVDGHTLAYTVSPIYGMPGLYVVNCRSREIQTLVGPRTINSAYPDGADYFELMGVSEDGSTLYLYYAADVEAVDFETFRSRSSQYTIRTRGGDLQPLYGE